MSEKALNLKIVGGIAAVPSSWPSHALVKLFVKTDFRFSDGKITTLSQGFMCAGTLINRYTVLTAAHCILTKFDYGYQGDQYTIPVSPNKYYPTQEAMFRVYLGAYNMTNLKTNSVISRSIARIVKVNDKYTFNFKIILRYMVLSIPNMIQLMV